MRLAEARSGVRETLRRGGFEEHCGSVVAVQPVSQGDLGVAVEWLTPSLPEAPSSMMSPTVSASRTTNGRANVGRFSEEVP